MMSDTSEILQEVVSRSVRALEIRSDRIYCAGVMPVYSLKFRMNQLTLICCEAAYSSMLIFFVVICMKILDSRIHFIAKLQALSFGLTENQTMQHNEKLI